MNNKEKSELLLSVKASVVLPIGQDGKPLNIVETFQEPLGWGSSQKEVAWKDIINDPVLTLKKYPRLRSKIQASDRAFDLINTSTEKELINLINYKHNAKKIDS